MKYSRIPVAIFLVMIVCFSISYAENVVVNEESGKAYRDGLELFKKGKYNEAATLFEKSYSLDDRNINALFAHGTALTKLGKNDKAAEDFEKILTIDPKHEKSLRMLPVALTNAGKTEEALAAYDKGISLFPENANFFFGKSVLLMKLGKNKDAIPLLVKAAEIEPGRIEILEKLMFAYREIGDSENGYKIARTILEKDPKHSWSLVMAGDYYRANEKYQDALNAYSIAAKSIDTKAYAEHYIEVINQTLEELEIEKEYEARTNKN